MCVLTLWHRMTITSPRPMPPRAWTLERIPVPLGIDRDDSQTGPCIPYQGEGGVLVHNVITFRNDVKILKL